MACYPLFLSVVVVVRNHADALVTTLAELGERLAELAENCELIVVDNASDDNSVAVLRGLTGEEGLADLQIYALNKQVDLQTASWVGVESALGDFVAVMDPTRDDADFLATMLQSAVCGHDVVFARNANKSPAPLAYRLAQGSFHRLYRAFSGVHLAHEAPPFRLLSKKVVNLITQHPQPALAYRHLPATAGFARTTLSYEAPLERAANYSLMEGFDRGIRLLVSTTRAPLRLVTAFCTFGAAANLLYSAYVVGIALFAKDVAPGWISMSLQQSGMFFLLSLVLLVLGEYMIHVAALSSEGPVTSAVTEFTSVRLRRRERLNVVDTDAPVRRMPDHQPAHYL